MLDEEKQKEKQVGEENEKKSSVLRIFLSGVYDI